MAKKILKRILLILLIIILIVAGYFAYVFLTYYRVEDNHIETVEGTASFNQIETNTPHCIASANVGFGAYSDDYSFFMDGGTESWAFSEEAVVDNINGSMDTIKDINAEIVLLQEIDVDATRSYHVNQKELAVNSLTSDTNLSLNYVYSQDYDSPFLMYPIRQPHGASKAGLVTATPYAIQSAIRRSLPIEEGVTKLIDLDRCYTKHYIDTDNGKQLVVINMHLSAYTTDPSTAENQIIMLSNDMKAEYEKGNYVIAGGDMNKDLLGDSASIFKKGALVANWASPFPTELLDEGLALVAPFDETNPIPSCRNADVPYSDENFVLTVDGFIVSDNVEVIDSNVCSNDFKYSDHQPVYLNFILK